VTRKGSSRGEYEAALRGDRSFRLLAPGLFVSIVARFFVAVSVKMKRTTREEETSNVTAQTSETGIKRLIREYADRFRISENLNNYSAEDLEKAQKKFIKYCLQEGCAWSREGLPHRRRRR
jgi:hypothetical protein